MIRQPLIPWPYTALLASLLTCPATAQVSAGRPPTAAVAVSLQTADAKQGAPLPEVVSVEEAVRVGVARNPQTAAGVAGVASAAANYRSIAALPSLQLGVTRAQGTSTAPTLNGTTSDTFIDLGEVVDTSGQRHFQAAGAKAQYRATGHQLDETKLTLEQQIRDAYWSLAAAQALTRYALESLQEAEHVNQLIRTQQEAGASPRADVVRSTIDVANARQAYIAAQGAEVSALSGFNLLLVRPPTAPVKLADTVEVGVDSKTPIPTLPTLGVLTKSALANRPLVKSAVELVRAADYTVKQTRASRLPDLTVDYERSLQQSTDTVLFGVRFPLLDFGNTHYSIRAAQETHKQASAQLEQAEQQVVQQVAQAFQDITQSQSLLASYLTEILNPSITLRDMAQLGYEQGATGILPVIDAETTLRSARTGYVNSLLAVHKAQDEMNAALGGPLPH